MQCEVTRFIICIFNKVESLNKENSYKNFTKEVILSFEEIFAMQSRKFWTKFRVIMIVKIEKAPRELKKGILKNFKQKKNFFETPPPPPPRDLAFCDKSGGVGT